MAKRFKETDLWDQDWYLELSNEYKVFWDYINDTCNHAGIWEPSLKKFEFCTGWKIDLDRFEESINRDRERIIHLTNGRYWIIDFIAFQQGRRLSITNNAHKGTLRELAANGIHFNTVKGLQYVNLDGIDDDEKALITPKKVDPKLTPTYPQLESSLNPKVKIKVSDKVKEKNTESNSNNGKLKFHPSLLKVCPQLRLLELSEKDIFRINDLSNQTYLEAECFDDLNVDQQQEVLEQLHYIQPLKPFNYEK